MAALAPNFASFRKPVPARVLIMPAVLASWLCGVAPAFGEGGGAASEAMQEVLNDTCTGFGISRANCPQLPTVNQIVVEVAAIIGITPDEAARGLDLPTGTAVNAGTLVSVTGKALENPLGFISSSHPQGQPTPTA